MRTVFTLGLAAAVALPLYACNADARPAGFADLPYDQALEQAKATHKLLIVDFMAEWCGPCKVMDKGTWPDPEITKWVGEHAIAIQVDVDENEKLARSMHINAMPTVVVFRDGEEFDRVVGLRQPEELLAWLRGVEEGKRAADSLVGQAGDRAAPDGAVDIQARMQLARSLADAGQTEKATEEYLWLWDHMLEHNPAYYGVRLSFLVADMGRLARRDDKARAAFAGLRNALEARLRSGDATMDNLLEWIVLNDELGDADRTLAWYDRVKSDPEAAESVARVEFRLRDVLERYGRWADMGRILRNPVFEANRRLALLDKAADGPDVEGDLKARVQAAVESGAYKNLGALYAACLAAGREDDAERIATLLLARLDTADARLVLVSTALEARQARPVMRDWLDQAAAKGGDADRVEELQRQLDAALNP